jgi:hypothetical protein
MQVRKFNVEITLHFTRAYDLISPTKEVEPDFTIVEVDTFMKEIMYPFPKGKSSLFRARYYFLVILLTEFFRKQNQDKENTFSNVQYHDNGKLTFVLNINGEHVDERCEDLVETITEEGIGPWLYEINGGMEITVPTRNKYRYMKNLVPFELSDEYDLGHIILGHIDYEEKDVKVSEIK